MKKTWDDLKKYFFEVLAIITAITLSFLFDEWREKRRDNRDSITLLTSISDNLKKDTAILAQTVDFQKKMIAGELHVLRHADSLRPDSLMLGMLAIQTYSTFRRTDVSYLTMVQTGQARVIMNKKLLAQITDLYESQYSILDEWEEIERRYVLEAAIPYINSNAPHVRNYNYASLLGKNPKLDDMLKRDDFRNLLNTDYAFKATLNAIYLSVQKSVDSLLVNVNKEIKVLNQ